MHYNLNVNFNEYCSLFFLVGTRQSLHNLCLIEIQIKIRAATNIAKTWTNFVTKAQISISNQQIVQTNNFHTISDFFIFIFFFF